MRITLDNVPKRFIIDGRPVTEDNVVEILETSDISNSVRKAINQHYFPTSPKRKVRKNQKPLPKEDSQ